ncbi:hypothetical protein Acsp06_15620 [Actinomycetospora sp. NBRC 106375]|uniref:hypothetical protein n=1 Tax=Actinomycetospora sp. NBRC 106375 TaxID=3032207 RepID=UPI0024A0FC36|nr:hypothetical protein [Actinomycetospora sp. NBRC 106375]GLZ45377.1 hypothetical protein Acsp06_15620 [Actinomycetospora sp. NBRC 106375]
MSAGAEGTRADICREVSHALAPCSRCDGGVTLSGSAAAALAELFRSLAREGDEVPDAAVRAARRLLADLEPPADAGAPEPRAPADRTGPLLASR